MWKNKIKQFWNEHPVETIVIVTIALTALAKTIDAASAAQGRRAYAKQVNYRVKQ